jgi:archaemetzincin
MHHRRQILRLGLLCGGFSISSARLLAEAAALSPATRLQGYKSAAEKIRHLFEKKKPPEFGDWLDQKKEPGQSFGQFLANQSDIRTANLTRLYLQPIGDFSDDEWAVLKILQEYMNLHFGLEVVELKTISTAKIPPGSRRYQPGAFAEQLHTSFILDRLLIPNRPKDAVAVLAITVSDLWPGDGWNFVFGVASLKQRVGVWSTSRLGDPVKERARFLRRVLQVAVHETGHMFGIRHCIAYDCCMNGSNSLQESDRASMVFCCECDPKLWWSCQLDPAPRAKALAEFFKRHALEREEKQWNQIALALAKP